MSSVPSRETRARGSLALPFLLAALCLSLVPAALRAMPAASPDDPPAVAGDYEKVANAVLCDCGCARQTVYECTCGHAHELRARFESELRAGRTPDEVIAAFIDEKGEQVRAVPEAKGFNAIAWFGPGAAILVAAIAVVFVLIRWTRPAPPAPHPVPTREDEQSRSAYEEKLARDLSRMDS